MFIFELLALAILLVAFFQIVRVLIGRPVKEQSLTELECEMITLDTECALAVQRSREESNLLEQPNQNLG
jgi:hypothetical protein